ncbi:MAG: 30S ribosomal protein S6 [Acidobacteria bacterium 13_1_40CM_2_68_5]|nr:MAG: 30S ribosomal protein S6 [Acidobacteria bacterium 13_1_40CM_2_68_5]OLE67812.1 MAG: 30S ribosomal protein S6 [Acidobacteria bacterium 13_1_20CM_2_68_7]
MLQYETVFIADSTYTDEEIDELIKGYDQIITSAKGKMIKVEKWGKRRLAYAIRRNEEGVYVLMTIECPPSLVKELDRRYRMNDRILRHLVVRVENEAQLGPSPMMKPRPERDELLAEPPLAP